MTLMYPVKLSEARKMYDMGYNFLLVRDSFDPNKHVYARGSDSIASMTAIYKHDEYPVLAILELRP